MCLSDSREQYNKPYKNSTKSFQMNLEINVLVRIMSKDYFYLTILLFVEKLFNIDFSVQNTRLWFL